VWLDGVTREPSCRTVADDNPHSYSSADVNYTTADSMGINVSPTNATSLNDTTRLYSGTGGMQQTGNTWSMTSSPGDDVTTGDVVASRAGRGHSFSISRLMDKVRR